MFPSTFWFQICLSEVNKSPHWCEDIENENENENSVTLKNSHGNILSYYAIISYLVLPINFSCKLNASWMLWTIGKMFICHII